MPKKNENLQDTKTRGKVFITSPPPYNTDVLHYASIAEKLGYEARLNTYSDTQKTMDEIKNFMPDFLVVKVTFDKFRTLLELMENIKKIFPVIKIIVTGEPFLTYNRNVTYENPYIDYAVFGEGEYTLRDILDGVPNDEILGISYTDDNMQSAKNELRPLIENLDNLPMPARHLLKENKNVTIEISRGCPLHCFFCLESPNGGEKLRTRSVESVIGEIEHCIKEFKTENFYFKSAFFNFDKDWATRFCSTIIEKGLKIKWSSDIVPSNIDEETVKLMKKSGCKLCKIGIESGSDEILSKIGKNITKESIKETVSILKKYKIKTKGYFIIGLPWETEATVNETSDFASELDIDEAVFNIGIPFPGTNFFVYSMLNKLFPPQTQFVNANKKALIRSHTLTKERITELRDEAENKFYSRPKFIIKSFIKKLFFKN